MIFAAGFGTRMGALTANRPKPLIEVAGRPLIDHALGLARAAGIARVVVNTHYLADQLATHLEGRPGVSVSHEPDRILDTGGGLRAALPLLGGGPVFTLNSDAVWTGPNPLRQLAESWDPGRMDGLLLLVDADRARGYRGVGDFSLDPEGRLSRGGPGVYTGAQILTTALLAEVAEPAFSLNTIWTRMIAEHRLFGLRHAGGWCDVGHPDGIAAAEAMLEEADRG